MKSKKKDFLLNKYIKVIDSFENEYGEEFVVYAPLWKSGFYVDYIFVTGDELDWEDGFRIDPVSLNLVRDFVTNTEEKEKLLKILNKYSNK